VETLGGSVSDLLLLLFVIFLFSPCPF
jgi:hypothetical protein